MKLICSYLALTFLLRAHLWAQDNWRWQNPLPTGNRLNSVYAFDQNTALVVGDLGSVQKTTDGGASWSAITNVRNTFVLNAASFINAKTGWAVGRDESYRGYLLKTTDGGDSWVLQGVVQPGSEEFLSVHFIDANTGWAVGWDRSCPLFGSCTYFGIIYRTTDGGTTWSAQNSATGNDLQSIFFANVNSGWAVGANGVILRTTNSGNNWSALESGTRVNLNAVQFADLNTGYAVGLFGTILKSSDGGNTWEKQSSGTSWELRSVSFINAQVGWVVGVAGTILKTTDGGNTWLPQTSGTNQWLTSVSFIDANIGWAVGYSGIALKTTDGGAVWVTEYTGTSYALNSVQVGTQGARVFGWAVGTNGVMYKLSDDGNIWSAQDRVTINSLRSVRLVLQGSDFAAWAVGANGTILRTGELPVVVEEPDGAEGQPEGFALYRNFPNPFNPTTTIEFALPQASYVVLKVYDMLGHEVQTLVNDKQAEGKHRVQFDGKDLPSGVYLYRLQAGTFTQARKFTLVR